ncbi:MAG: T9SS C-terminal target domain-containing protein [Calditrichaeota bacterium]|nr:MAG: T9SS C-terminal target domain-containing protein [Calditrichota bacterium]
MKLLLALILFFAAFANSQAQNKLGIWLWFIEGTGFTHSELADTLATIGVKRIYVKVADGSLNTTTWPEVADTTLVQTYKNAGLEVWAWSYNYDNNYNAQANALTLAAQTGYEGYVVDIETEFNNKTTELHSLFSEFESAKNSVIANGTANSDFKLYCTTWGNPITHNMHIEIIDQYVDGHMPQTYVEKWGIFAYQNVVYTVNQGTLEYQSFGIQNPVHHLVSAELNVITATKIDSFFMASGSESALWRVPGAGTTLNIWNTLNSVNWNADFSVSAKERNNKPQTISLSQNYPNPFNPSTSINYEIQITNYDSPRLSIYNVLGNKIKDFTLSKAKGSVVWDGKNFEGKQVSSGKYFYELKNGTERKVRQMTLIK